MGKKKYTTEFKLEIVERYLKGTVGLKSLAQEYQVHHSDILKWENIYLEYGIAGLENVNRTYSGEFKIAVVEYMYNTGATIRKTAAHFNIPSHTTISAWERIYKEQGKDALLKEGRGRTAKMKNKRPKKSKTNNTKGNEDLLAELEYLRMENEYLKKLNALVQEREKSEKPTK